MDRREFLFGSLMGGLSATANAEVTDPTVADLQAQLASALAETELLRTALAECQSKPVARGIFSRKGRLPASGSPAQVATVNVSWRDLEAVPGVYTLAPIDSYLDAVEARGLAGVRLRPMLGIHAPPWAKQLGGGPIPYADPQSGLTAEIGNLWNAEYQQAAASLFAAIAQSFDADARLRLVFATGGMTWYGEPLIRGISVSANRQALLGAGYTKEADAALQTAQLDWMGPFTTTPIGLAYNPWQYVNADGTAGMDATFTGDVMDHQIALFGSRTVLQTNNLRETYIAAPPSYYALFTERPQVEHQFQCAASKRVGDEDAAIVWAHDAMGASGIEWAGTLTWERYRELDALLKS